MKAMIVDDKTAAIELLRWRIQEHCPEITNVVSATSIAEALPLLQNFQPDILFLDIQFPQETGFDLLARVNQWSFEVIFTTAFNEYAIQAIRLSALDYLLKPITGEDLCRALERYKAKKESKASGGEESYRTFLQNLTRSGDSNLRLALPGVSGTQYVWLKDIVRLQAERNYTRIYFTNKKNFLSSKTLAEFEKLLRDAGFVRVHRSHLVNSQHIIATQKDVVQMNDGSEVEVSRRKKAAVENKLNEGKLGRN
jgi:two-component system LytT family response regulator